MGKVKLPSLFYPKTLSFNHVADKNIKYEKTFQRHRISTLSLNEMSKECKLDLKELE